jgi:hypothetical protein
VIIGKEPFPVGPWESSCEDGRGGLGSRTCWGQPTEMEHQWASYRPQATLPELGYSPNGQLGSLVLKTNGTVDPHGGLSGCKVETKTELWGREDPRA